MLLDQLFDHLSVRVQPFAVCILASGWRLRLPGPPDVMLHFVLQGSGSLRGPRGPVLPLYPLSLALVPHDLPHALECGAVVNSERVIESAPPHGRVAQLVAGPERAPGLRVACGLVQVTYGDSLALFRHLSTPLVVDLSPFPRARDAFEGILAEQSSGALGSTALAQTLMRECLIYLLRRLSQAPDPPLPWLAALQDPGLARVLDLLLANPAAPHSVASLADKALMSRSAFAARFHAAFGYPPLALLHDLRLRKAADLLQQSESLTIDQVAHRVGFASRSHFSETFRARFGVTPTAYRTAR